MRYRMTQTLLSSYAYMFNCVEGFEEEAKESFLATLRREPVEPNEAMANGIAFENEVYAAAANLPRPPHNKWEEGIQKVARLVKGAPVQVYAERDIEVNGMEFRLLGYLDALKAGTILDVKFLNKSMGSVELAGKYLESPQHPAYFYLVPEATEFKYLVSDGKDIYIESYSREMTHPIDEYISDFINGITEMGLLEVYKEKWQEPC